MNKKEIIEKWKENYHKEKIALLNIKIKRIQEDIIQLKSENRAIGDKVRSYYKNTEDACCKMKNNNYYVYEGRIIRDIKTVYYLEKLQEVNGKLIRKHRAKVKELRTELSVYEFLSMDV